MYIYLKELQYYEDRYDKSTIEVCRRGERMVNQTFAEMQKKLSAKELKQHMPGWYLQYSVLYFSLVEMPAAIRVGERDEAIAKWMKQDEDKDRRLTDAGITGDAYCRSCAKNMHVISKDYMHREGYKEDDVLLIFECEACNKRKAFWQDGTEWEGSQRKCEQCGGNVKSTHKTKGKVITTTITCAKCGHIEMDVMDLSKDPVKEDEPIDPYYELDRKRFVFDSDMVFKCQQKAHHLERLHKLHAATTDRVEHVDVYDAVKAVKRLKIAQLSELLTPVFSKKQYSDFKLGQPQLGREVSLDFNCLDAKDDREEYQSKKDMQKLIEKTLIDTNWRLMSDGVSYRLGYLSGRLRAYETEEDIKKLVEQRMKKGYVPKVEPKETPAPKLDVGVKMDGATMRESALVYMHNMTLGSMPAEITLKSGKIKKTSIPILTAEMNPLLRVFIPMRDGDDSVPEFIRNYDFKMDQNDVDLPKVRKDSQGREIRML
jgi:phosphohistidine phosphatase SixA